MVEMIKIRTILRFLLVASLSSLLVYLWYHRISTKESTPVHITEKMSALLSFQVSYMVQSNNWRSLSPPDPANPRADFEFIVSLSANIPKLKSVYRLKTPSPQYFRDYIAPAGVPVIFTDMLKGTSFEDWSWDYLKRRFGHIVFNNTRQGDYRSSSSRLGKQEINRISVRFSDFIDVVSGMREPLPEERDMYITKQQIIPRETLLNEFVWPPFYNKGLKCYLEPSAWIGSANTFTQGHFDSKDNFAYQIIGSKQWTVYPPSDYSKLYFVKAEGKLEWSAGLKIQGSPDLKKYPLLAETNPVTFTLSEGEVLYLPRGWTHVVKNLSPAVMINIWRRGPAAMGARFIPKKTEEIERLCMS